MRWSFSAEHDAYQQSLRDWLGAVAPPPTVRDWLEAGDAGIFERRFASDGWSGVGLPEALGGQGGGLVELALTAEELARAAAPSGAWLATTLAAPALAEHSRLVESALADSTAVLFVSADCAPDTVPVIEVGSEGSLSGAVLRVLAADTATQFVVPVRTGDGVALRLVDAAGTGVTVTRRPLLDRTRSVADVTLDAAPATHLDVDAMAVLAGVAARAAVLVAADSLGAAQRMLDLAVDYSKERTQFGVPVGSFQAVKHAAATILVGVEAARSVVYFAAASVEGDDAQALLHAAAAKAQVTAEGVRAADSALTMHGAIGFTWEHDLHLFYKRAKLDERLYGSPSEWNERIADGLALI